MSLILQEVSGERWIDIPEEVLDIYRLWRPTPLYRAYRLERELGTRSKIFYKYEGTARPAATSRTPPWRRPSASSRTAASRLATETGAGQWGSALAFACAQFGLECKVYMVQGLVEQKPFRRSLMARGGRLRGEPVRRTPPAGAGQVLAEPPGLDREPRHRDLRGGRGRRGSRDDTAYSLGSVLNHVLMHRP